MGRKLSWEKKFENLLSQEPISKKIGELESDIENLKANKVIGNFRSKEEYQTALKERKKEIRKVEKKLKEYSNFQKNKNKILNILEYRKRLEVKLKNLIKNAKPVFIYDEEQQEELKNRVNERDARQKRIEMFQKEILDINEKLKGDITEEERQECEIDIQSKEIIIGSLNEAQNKLNKTIKKLEKPIKRLGEETEKKKVIYEREIAKCNTIASILLQGKDLSEFTPTTEQEDKKFTSNDDKIKKQQNKKSNIAKKLGIREGDSSIKNLDEMFANEEKKAQIQKNMDKQSIPDKKDLVGMSKFAQRYPKLSKFLSSFKNFINKFNKKKGILENKEENKQESTIKGEEINTSESNKKEEREQRENKLLLDIAENGFEQTLRERIKVVDSANKYAKKYGGIYENQDGATYRKKRSNTKGTQVEEKSR